MSRIYNKVFDPAIWEQVNPRNKELLGDFVMDLKENRRSEGTIRQYEYNLRNLFCYTFRTFENRFILELNRKELKRYALAHDIYEMFCPMRDLLTELHGAEVDFGPHSMRHSALKNYKDGTHHVCKDLGKPGFPLDQLRVLAHHGSVETTRLYLPDSSTEELEGMFGIQIQ